MKITKVSESRVSTVDFDNLPFGQICTDHMFVMDYDNGAWQEGEIVPLQPFSIHPANLTLHYGQSIFEGMKAAQSPAGKPLLYRLSDHAERFNFSARRMCMPELPEGVFEEAIKTLVDLEQNWIPPQDGSSLYIRPFMFATEEFIGVRSSSQYKFVVFTCPVGPYYAKPVSLRADTEYFRATPGGVGAAKTAGNYAASLYADKKAKNAGYDNVLWLDPAEAKYIQEVGTMNICFVIDGVVVTPRLNGAILNGITRRSVLTILKSKGYPLEERQISIDEVIEAHQSGTLQEVFGTGTAAVISIVHRIAYKDVVMDIDIDKYEIAPMLKSTIEGVRRGTLEDEWGWVTPV